MCDLALWKEKIHFEVGEREEESKGPEGSSVGVSLADTVRGF